MSKISCIIVDDEPIARQIIRNYCEKLAFIDVIAECENALNAMEVLKKNHVQLMFLDINMPILNGLSLLKTLNPKPKVILTTAYKEHALDAFELQVSDYLLKPFSFERFLGAIQKVQKELTEKTTPSEQSISIKNDDFDGIFLKIGKTIYRYAFQDILFLEAQQNYTRVVTINDDIRVYQSLSHIETQLPAQFLRCHRSYIVNKNHVSKIDGNLIVLQKYEIAIGPNQRDVFMEKLGLG
jgi:DNA-binding LytR/AlgR family response regulator